MKLLWWLTRDSKSTSFAISSSASSTAATSSASSSVYKATSQLVFTMFTVSTLLHPVYCQINNPCGQEELNSCAKSLSVLSSTSELTIIANKKDLDNLCPELKLGLQCIHSYTRRCMDQNTREHFHKLYHGTSEMVSDLCEDENYKEDFLRHAPCIRVVKKNFLSCEKRYEETLMKVQQRSATTTTTTTVTPWMVKNYTYEMQATAASPESNDEDNIRMICCAFQEYKECSEETVHNTCGYETAKFTKKFLDRMSSELIQMHCKDYNVGSAICSPLTSSTVRLHDVQHHTSYVQFVLASCILVTTFWHL